MNDFQVHFEAPILKCAQLHQRWFTPTITTNKARTAITSNNSTNGNDDDDARHYHNMPFLQRALCFNRNKKSSSSNNSNTSKNSSFDDMLVSSDQQQEKQKKSISKKSNERKKAVVDVIEIIEKLVCEAKDITLKLSSTAKKRKEIDSSSPFPLYDPLTSPPFECKPAFTLFCKSNRDKARGCLSREFKSDKLNHMYKERVRAQLKIMWDELEDEELLQWKRNEEWDKKRYEHQKKLYVKVVFKRHNTVRSIDVTTLLPKTDSNSYNHFTPNAFFHFVYMTKDNLPAVQSGPTIGYRCPICFYNPTTSEKLVGHCKSIHDGLFFDAVLDEEQNLHVIVTSDKATTIKSSKKSQYVPFQFAQDKQKSQTLTIPYLQRPVEIANTEFDEPTRKQIIACLQSNNAPSSIIQRYQPTSEIPIRQYYHSRTNLPISPEEWDYDSDDSTDDAWIHKIRGELLQDFEDVSHQEKAFMKLWNQFMFSHSTPADSALLTKCLEFIQRYHKDLSSLNMRKCLFLHLLNFINFSLISSRELSTILKQYDSITNISGNKETVLCENNGYTSTKCCSTNTNSLLSKQINGTDSKNETSTASITATPSLQNSLTSQSDDATTTTPSNSMNQEEDISSTTDNEAVFFL